MLNCLNKVVANKGSKATEPKKKYVNTVDEEPHPVDSVNFSQSSKLYESDYSNGDDNIVATVQSDISTTLLVDSRSARSNLNQSLVTRVVNRSTQVIWVRENIKPQLQTF